MPKEAADSSVPGIQKGVAWYYVDANTKSALIASEKTLDDMNQVIFWYNCKITSNKYKNILYSGSCLYAKPVLRQEGGSYCIPCYVQ